MSLFTSSKVALRQMEQKARQSPGQKIIRIELESSEYDDEDAPPPSSEIEELSSISFDSAANGSNDGTLLNDHLRAKFTADFLANVICFSMRSADGLKQKGGVPVTLDAYQSNALDGHGVHLFSVDKPVSDLPFSTAYLVMDELQKLMFTGFKKDNAHGHAVYHKTIDNSQYANIIRDLFVSLSGAMGMTELMTDITYMNKGGDKAGQMTIEIPAAIYEKMLAQEKPIIIPSPSR